MTHFWPFWHHWKMAVTWLYATLFISIGPMLILSRTARWCQCLINSAFLSIFWGCQKSALIARPILKTPSGSISFNSWLRCYQVCVCVHTAWRRSINLLMDNSTRDTQRHHHHRLICPTVCTSTSVQFRGAGRQGPTRTLTAVLAVTVHSERAASLWISSSITLNLSTAQTVHCQVFP